MASDCTDIDVVLRQINQRLRKLEKSDSEKTEEIGRLNRVINQKDVEIHNLKTELASTKAELAVAKERIKELKGADDDTSSTPGKPEKNSSNSSIPPSQESIASRELRRTKSLRKPSGKPSGGQPGHKGHTLQTIAEPDVIVKHEPVYCKCCGRLLIDIPCQKIRKTQIVDIKVVVETCEEQYYEKVCECGCVNNFRSKAKKIISFSTRDELTIGQLEAIRASLNSYLGYLGHYKSYKIIHKSLTGSAVFKHLYFASGYKKSIPYKRYTNKRRERCEIAHDLNRILTA